MLADQSFPPASGRLDKTVQVPGAFREEVIGFMAKELPLWKERLSKAERQESETFLTDRLRSHLNSATHHSDGFDVLQFGTEVPDEMVKGRAIDLAARPCAAIIVIEGRAYTDFETILPVECKRLPTPRSQDRDEREYVYSALSSTGGIQRFKAGHHGGAHKLGAMIAYLQEGEASVWEKQISKWIHDLAEHESSSWSLEDLLRPAAIQPSGVAHMRSSHRRKSGLGEITIEHLWLEMN
jgi:hypothetical protein